jgi:hypothetical protein
MSNSDRDVFFTIRHAPWTQRDVAAAPAAGTRAGRARDRRNPIAERRLDVYAPPAARGRAACNAVATSAPSARYMLP